MEVTRWELGQTGFDRLLQELSSDRDTAAAEYERLRFRLIKFFEWRGCREPEEFADRALDRLARRLEAGERIEPLHSYCYGIARMLLLEEQRTRQQETATLAHLAVSQLTGQESVEAIPLEALETCLGRLPEDSRRLVLDYYQGEKQGLIDRRKALAARLGIPMNALRLRACRIRAQLEQCVHQSLGDTKLRGRSYQGE